MKVNKDTETGIVTYTMPNGKTFSAAYKNASYCVACDGDEVPSTWGGKTYMIGKIVIMITIVLRMISQLIWHRGKLWGFAMLEIRYMRQQCEKYNLTNSFNLVN